MSCKNGIGAGAFNRKVQLLSYTESKDSVGAPLNLYVELAEVWAKVVEKSVSENENITMEQSFLKSIFTIRKTTDYTVTPKHKIIYKNKGYNIEAVLKKNNKQYLEIIAHNAELVSGESVNNVYLDADNDAYIGQDGEVWVWE